MTCAWLLLGRLTSPSVRCVADLGFVKDIIDQTLVYCKEIGRSAYIIIKSGARITLPPNVARRKLSMVNYGPRIEVDSKKRVTIVFRFGVARAIVGDARTITPGLVKLSRCRYKVDFALDQLRVMTIRLRLRQTWDREDFGLRWYTSSR